MNILTQKQRYRELKKRMKEWGFSAFSSDLMKILGTHNGRAADLNQGRRNFEPREIFKICEALNIEPTPANFLKFFPPMGLEAEEDDELEKFRNQLIQVLGGKAS